MANRQGAANVFGRQALHQVGGDFAFAGGEFGFDGASLAQVFKTPDAGFVRRVAVQGAAGHVAPKGFAFEAAVQAAHDAVVGVAAAAVEDGCNARAGALKLVGAGVEHLKTLAQQLFARGTKNLADALVAIHDGAVAREHQAHRGHVKRQSVINVHGAGRGQGEAGFTRYEKLRMRIGSIVGFLAPSLNHRRFAQ